MSFLVLISLLIIFWIGWRLYSNRHNLPCPACLSWMIAFDNPFAKADRANEIIQTIKKRMFRPVAELLNQFMKHEVRMS